MTRPHFTALMRYLVTLVVAGIVPVIALASCTLAYNNPTPTDTPPNRETATPTAAPTLSTTTITPVPTLATDTGPYDNVTYLLSGICFEYLYAQNGLQWTWQSPADMAAFFAAAGDSELCPVPVRPATFDFGDQVLAGAIATARGCDAAFRYESEARDNATQTITVQMRLLVQPGCEYDLVQPVVIALPRPTDEFRVMIEVLP